MICKLRELTSLLFFWKILVYNFISWLDEMLEDGVYYNREAASWFM